MKLVFVMDTTCPGMLSMKAVLQFVEMVSLCWKRNVMMATTSQEMDALLTVEFNFFMSALVSLPTAVQSGTSHLAASRKMAATVSVCFYRATRSFQKKRVLIF